MSARHAVRSVWAVILSAVFVSGALAQTAPYGNGPSAPPTIPTAASPTQPAPVDNGYRPSYYPETYYNDFPMRDVRAVPPVIMQTAIAGAVQRRAQSNLDLMVLELKKAFERTRDWAAAVNEEREAWAALEAARKDALRSVFGDPAYQASVSLRNSLAEQIQQRRQDKQPNLDEILAMSQVKMGYASTATAMEAAALAASPEVQQARERLRRASSKLSELRLAFDLSVRHNPDVQLARRNFSDATIAYVGMASLREALIDAAEFSVRYAYWYNQYNYYQYLSYGYYGYNYPPYGTYGIGYPIGWGNGMGK